MATKVTNLLRGVIDQPFAADALIGPHLTAEAVDGWRLLQVEPFEGGWRWDRPSSGESNAFMRAGAYPIRRFARTYSPVDSCGYR